MLTHIVFLQVAVLKRGRIACRRKGFCHMMGDEYRPVHTSGAADSDDKLALTLSYVLRHQEAQEIIQLLQKFVGHFMTVYKLSHRRNCAALMLQLIKIEGIRQEPHIKYQICIVRNPIFKTK